MRLDHHVGIDFSHLIHHLHHDEITILILLLASLIEFVIEAEGMG